MNIHGNLFRLLILVAVQMVAPVLAQGDQLLNRLEPSGYVNDFANVFSPSQETALENLLSELDRKSGAEVAVVTLNSLQGGEIQDFSNRLFEKWGIGKKGKDNGVLLLAALEEHQIRIEVGYGLEPLLPDARVGRIIDTYILPEFRQGRFAEGLTAGAVATAQIIASNAGVELTGQIPQVQVRDNQPRPLSWLETIIGLIVLIIMIPVFIRHPWLLFLLLSSGRGGGGFSGGGFGRGGGFGGFGGGLSGGGGAGRSW